MIEASFGFEPERVRDVALRVGVDDEDAKPSRGETRGDAHARRRFSGAAFVIEDRDATWSRERRLVRRRRARRTQHRGNVRREMLEVTEARAVLLGE